MVCVIIMFLHASGTIWVYLTELRLLHYSNCSASCRTHNWRWVYYHNCITTGLWSANNETLALHYCAYNFDYGQPPGDDSINPCLITPLYDEKCHYAPVAIAIKPQQAVSAVAGEMATRTRTEVKHPARESVSDDDTDDDMKHHNKKRKASRKEEEPAGSRKRILFTAAQVHALVTFFDNQVDKRFSKYVYMM